MFNRLFLCLIFMLITSLILTPYSISENQGNEVIIKTKQGFNIIRWSNEEVNIREYVNDNIVNDRVYHLYSVDGVPVNPNN